MNKAYLIGEGLPSGYCERYEFTKIEQIHIPPTVSKRLSKDSPHPRLLKSLAFTRDIKTKHMMIYETKTSCNVWNDLKLQKSMLSTKLTKFTD